MADDQKYGLTTHFVVCVCVCVFACVRACEREREIERYREIIHILVKGSQFRFDLGF